MNWENLARAGYEKWREALLVPAAPGLTISMHIPTWDGLAPDVRRAWIEAAREICDIHVRAALA